jgi:symplekin
LNIVFETPHIFKQDLVAGALSQLVSQIELPTLLLRLVMQALSQYPSLSGFVNQLLVRLAKKSIWRNPRLWDGFIRTVNVSFF